MILFFQNRLNLLPMLMHSGLTNHERLKSWKAAQEGTAGILLGTRSAVFSPIKDLGLIIVDEEHDNSLKQQEGLRYSARDLAILRAKKEQISIILGSATPSAESIFQCQNQSYELIKLPKRAGKAVDPILKIIDLNKHGTRNGLSHPVIKAIAKTLKSGNQILVFLNRRGFAPTLICQACNYIAECNRCDARLTVHAKKNLLICHHCGSEHLIKKSCSKCGSLCKPLGHGTERIEESLRLEFPSVKIKRIDSDSIRLKGSMNEALLQATSGETPILVGTQILSKGHHFPKLSLVIIINADQGLFNTDFRAPEKLAQSLIQVAGRAGREKKQGTVMIQTQFSDHPFWKQLINNKYDNFINNLLSERKKALWPPFSRIALIRTSSVNKCYSYDFLEDINKFIKNLNIPSLQVFGPVNAPMERKAGKYRAQLLLQTTNRKTLHRVLDKVQLELEGHSLTRRVRWSIDVDPIELF